MTERLPRLALLCLLAGCAAPPERPSSPSPGFEGRLVLDTARQHTRMEVVEDRYGVTSDPAWRVDELPALSLEYVTDGREILPASSAPLPSRHPYWEILPGPGRSWPSPGRRGWQEATISFALRERYQNCTHNGLLRFAWSEAGEITPVRWQVASETCLYLKLDLEGSLPARYEPGRVPGADKVLAARRALRAARLPLRPVGALATAFDLDPAALQPPDREHVSIFGYVVDGVHYRSACMTRDGPYPLCDELLLPSYSTAKALFAGLALRHLDRLEPGFAETPVTALVPECELPDGRWDGVTLQQLSDMRTGLFESEAFEADEGAQRMIDGFFIPTGNAARIEFACTAYPKKAPPGSRQVYHTSDTWLLGVAMNRYLKTRRGAQADLHRDLWLEEVLAELELSPATTYTLRSAGEDAQPYAGFGLSFTPDDAARLGLFLADQVPDFTQVPDWPAARGERYADGVWAVDASGITGCPGPLWIPFLSGFGGITIAMLPHASLFYVFGDGNTFSWLQQAAQLHAIQPWCKDTNP